MSSLLPAPRLSFEISAAAAEIDRLVPGHVGSLKVLLAEDNEINQMIAVSLLEEMGHTVTAVNDGEEAVEALLHEHFDLVLCDLQMPNLDGLGVAAAVRGRMRLAHLPLIAFTGEPVTYDRERCLDGGMDGYLTKPVVSAVLQQEIERVVSLPRPWLPRCRSEGLLSDP